MMFCQVVARDIFFLRGEKVEIRRCYIKAEYASPALMLYNIISLILNA